MIYSIHVFGLHSSNTNAKDTQWASHKIVKKGSNEQRIPCGSKCWSCSTVHARAFCSYEWSELVSKAKTQSSLADSITSCKLVLSSAKPRAFLQESLQDVRKVGMRIEKPFIAYTKPEFVAKYNVNPESLNMPVREIRDERGSAMQVVFVADTERTGRRCVLTHEMVLETEKKLCSPQDQLRASQAADTMNWLVEKQAKQDTLGFTTALTHDQILANLDEAKAKEEKEKIEQEQRSAEASVAPLQAGHSARSACEVEDEVQESIDAAAELVQAYALSSAPQKGKGKSKSKGKGGRGKRLGPVDASVAKKPRKSESSATSESAPGNAACAASVAPSSKYSSKKRAAAGVTQAQKYLDDLDPSVALAGGALKQAAGATLKQALYHTRRWLEAEDNSPENGEWIQLNARYELILKCIKLESIVNQPGSSADRRKLLTEVALCVDSWPACFQKRLLQAAVREEPLNDSASLAKWMAMVTPHTSGLMMD
eukprot:6455413-Amphidinium_carterae.3